MIMVIYFHSLTEQNPITHPDFIYHIHRATIIEKNTATQNQTPAIDIDRQELSACEILE
jgi:hypothetical protein